MVKVRGLKKEFMNYHIGITSIQFDHKPEGICTGRLIRSLLSRGHQITLFTSKKASLAYTHEKLATVVKPHRPRSPRKFFDFMARCSGDIPNNFYLWGKRTASTRLSPGAVPDLFYGRAWPHGSLIPAFLLSRRYSRPLILHFSDPFPPPNEQHPGPEFMEGLQAMINEAKAISFTNENTISYQQRFLSFPDDKAFVLKHIGPEPAVFGKPEQPKHFYHIGGVGRHRPALPLLEGFSLYHQSHPESRLFFVGSSEEYLRPLLRKHDFSFVELLPYTDRVQDVIRKAGVLVSIDAEVDRPIFTPTKVVEYLLTDRPVLSITPPGSPVEKLISRSPDTALAVTCYTKQAIAKGLEKVGKISFSQQAMQNRIAGMDDFRAESVCRIFEDKIRLICRRS